jgi:hypothetical protein
MEKKLSVQFVDECYNTINPLIDNLRSQIRENVKARQEYTIPEDEEDLSPTIVYQGGRHPEYASNPFSCVEKLEWSDKHKDVIIHTEDGEQMLRDCGIEDIMTLAITIATLNEMGSE